MDDTVKQITGCKNAYRALYILVFLVFSWFIMVRLTAGEDYAKKDPMNNIVFEWNWLENCCSMWPISHFIAFAIISFFNPNCEKMLFILGVVWELFEVLMNYIFRGTLIKQPMITGDNVQYSEIWWAGSFKDIFFNTLGIILGRTLRLMK